MPYQEYPTWEMTLEKAGCPEFKIAFKDPRGLKAGQQIRLQKAMVRLRRLTKENAEPTEEDEWALTALHEVATSLLVDWNVTDPETGELIDTKGPDPLGELPGDAYAVVIEEVGRRIMTPPKSA